ncbi:patatin [Rhodobacterales bacterium HKCCE3408]|nr:patatin [Rhodobacterales bacterium HKCCE3408]
MQAKRKVGLALGYGGARGWAHIGVIEALSELGVEVEIVTGSSVGAIVGAAHAAGRLAELRDWALSLTQAGFLQLVDIRPFSGGFVRGAGIEQVMTQIGVEGLIEDLPIPFTAVATDLETGREVWLRDGPILPAVRASSAIPGLLAPQQLGGRWLVDGAVTNPVPVTVARATGADIVISVNPNARRRAVHWEPVETVSVWQQVTAFLPESVRPETGEGQVATPQGVAVASAAIDIMTEYLRRTRMAADPADLELEVELFDMSFVEFHGAKRAIEAGRDIVAENAGRIREMCGLDGS